MKQQKLCKAGFMLVEATVGVALFYTILIVLLCAVCFITRQLSTLQQRHKAICAASYYAAAQNDDVHYSGVTVTIQQCNPPIAYTHPTIVWNNIVTTFGNEQVTLSAARYAV